jgi:hypothetical protein
MYKNKKAILNKYCTFKFCAEKLCYTNVVEEAYGDRVVSKLCGSATLENSVAEPEPKEAASFLWSRSRNVKRIWLRLQLLRLQV